MTGISKGVAFVEFHTIDHAVHTLQQTSLGQIHLDSSPLKIMFAKESFRVGQRMKVPAISSDYISVILLIVQFYQFMLILSSLSFSFFSLSSLMKRRCSSSCLNSNSSNNYYYFSSSNTMPHPSLSSIVWLLKSFSRPDGPVTPAFPANPPHTPPPRNHPVQLSHQV